MNKIKLREFLEAVAACVPFLSAVIVTVCLLFKGFTLGQLLEGYLNWFMWFYVRSIGPLFGCFMVGVMFYAIVLLLYSIWQTPLGRFLMTEATKLWLRLHS